MEAHSAKVLKNLSRYYAWFSSEIHSNFVDTVEAKQAPNLVQMKNLPLNAPASEVASCND